MLLNFSLSSCGQISDVEAWIIRQNLEFWQFYPSYNRKQLKPSNYINAYSIWLAFIYLNKLIRSNSHSFTIRIMIPVSLFPYFLFYFEIAPSCITCCLFPPSSLSVCSAFSCVATPGMFLVFVPRVFIDLYFAFVATLSFFVLLSSQFVVFLDSWFLCIAWLLFNKARLFVSLSCLPCVCCIWILSFQPYHNESRLSPETGSMKQNKKKNRL